MEIPSPALRLSREQALKRELGLLFRYWTTRQIWERLEAREADAKELNLALLRLFTNAFQLPKDGSGLRYAELSTPTEEIRELSARMTQALSAGEANQARWLAELQAGLVPWREAVLRYTADAIDLPLEQLGVSVKQWVNRTPPAEGQAESQGQQTA